MIDKALEDMEIWADEAVSYCFHVGHSTADTKMADYLNAAVKEVKRHREAVEVFKSGLIFASHHEMNYPDDPRVDAMLKALKDGDAILAGEKAATEARKS